MPSADVKERPILMNGAMVRALLAGTKTQTRRVAPIADLNIKQHSDDLVTWGVSFSKPVKGVLGSYSGGRFSDEQARRIIASRFCPFGQPGDRLWVREAFHGYHWDKPRAVYRADGERQRVRTQIESYEVGRWTPSIHMPRWASRITLEITNVRVERLCDISESDAAAEGVDFGNTTDPLTGEIDRDACEAFESLWESINGPGSWDANPWVWVVEFKPINLTAEDFTQEVTP